MKALALIQPWASAWCSPAKIHETRSWRTHFRGWLLVHASATRIPRDIGPSLDAVMDEHFGPHWGLELPRGALIGMVNVVDCVASTDIYRLGYRDHDNDDWVCGNFEPGRWGFKRDGWKVFKEPITWKGARGLFDVPDSVVANAEILEP